MQDGLLGLALDNDSSIVHMHSCIAFSNFISLAVVFAKLLPGFAPSNSLLGRILEAILARNSVNLYMMINICCTGSTDFLISGSVADCS